MLEDHTQICESQGRGPGWRYMFGNQHLKMAKLNGIIKNREQEKQFTENRTLENNTEGEEVEPEAVHES